MGSGGSNGNCTGDNDGAAIVTSQCVSACHNPNNAAIVGGGFDMTVNSSIGTRLVGVKSTGTSAVGSKCGGNPTPYLVAGSNPATGLLIDKIQKSTPECGDQMPLGGPPFLSSVQQQCLINWATTLTMAAQ
jgi:hypothetical protein